MKKELIKNESVITIAAQAFYGNRSVTKVKRENLDAFIQGYIDAKLFDATDVDRTMVKVPGTENLVIIFNKYMESRALYNKERLLEEKGVIMKPLAVIQEEGIEIYSRCIVCRINAHGELESLQREDCHKFMDYLAE